MHNTAPQSGYIQRFPNSSNFGGHGQMSTLRPRLSQLTSLSTRQVLPFHQGVYLAKCVFRHYAPATIVVKKSICLSPDKTVAKAGVL